MGADRLSSPIHWLGNGFFQTLAVSIWGTQVLHTCTQHNPQFTVLYYESEDMQTLRTPSPLKHATQLYFHCRSSPLPHHTAASHVCHECFWPMSECLWDIKALYAFVWTMCVCVWAQTNIYAHTLMLVKEQGLFTHRLYSSETDGMSWPAQGGTVAPPNGRLTACSTSPNVSSSLSSPKASAHLDSCHAKTRLSQNHTPSVFSWVRCLG